MFFLSFPYHEEVFGSGPLVKLDEEACCTIWLYFPQWRVQLSLLCSSFSMERCLLWGEVVQAAEPEQAQQHEYPGWEGACACPCSNSLRYFCCVGWLTLLNLRPNPCLEEFTANELWLFIRLKLSIGVTGYAARPVRLAVNTRKEKCECRCVVRTEVPGPSCCPQSFGGYELFYSF